MLSRATLMIHAGIVLASTPAPRLAALQLLLHTYVSKLPSDQYTVLRPLYRTGAQQYTLPQLLYCTVSGQQHALEPLAAFGFLLRAAHNLDLLTASLHASS